MEIRYNINEEKYFKYEKYIIGTGQWKSLNPSEFDTLKKDLGRSTSGHVHLVMHTKSGFVGALKEVYSDRQRELRAELQTLLLARDCPLLVRLIDGFTTTEVTPGGSRFKYCMLLEFAPFKTLDDLTSAVKGIGLAKSKFYIMEIATGLQFLHIRNIMHRDVKPGNVLIRANGHVALADFGLSMDATNGSRSQCGSYLTKPPEVWNNETHSLPVDAWMCGVLLYNLITNKWPFLSPNKEKQKVLVQRAEIVTDSGLCTDSSNLITKLLSVNPSERLTISQILEHPYVTSLEQPHVPPYTATELIEVLHLDDDEKRLIRQIIQVPS